MHIDSKARPSRIAAEPGRDKRVPPGTSQSPDAASASLPERRRARTRQARPSRNAAEPGRDKRVPPGSPQNPDAASASLPERRRARTRQARPSRIAAEPGRDKRVPPGSPQCSKESPFSGGTGLSRPQSPTRHFDGHGSLRRLLHMPRGMATLRQDPEETKDAACAAPPVWRFRESPEMPSPTLSARPS